MLIDFKYLSQKYRFNPQGVLHIGASTGQEAQAYHDLGVKRVVWIEAIPSVYTLLCLHLQKFQGQEAVQACISDVTGERVKFHISSNEAQSSSMLEFGTHSQVHPDVTFVDEMFLMTSTVKDLDLDLEGIDFLNIDLQGAELLALKGMGELLDNFKYAYLEVNEKELYTGCPLFPEINFFMRSAGFSFKEKKMCGSFGWGDAFYLK
ncbi:MAG: FkbM family methyltransferase [Bacteroidetes bacterium]|nr:FkbM family methyltransferase [Bacteroidota bacterium]